MPMISTFKKNIIIMRMLKKRLLLILLTAVFKLSAQDCMPETREDGSAINIEVAKALKFYAEDAEIEFKKAGFGIGPLRVPGKKAKSEYMRHSFVSQWKNGKTSSYEEIRIAYVAVAFKTPEGCRVHIMYLRQQSLGAGKYGNIQVWDNWSKTTEGQYSKYVRENADCECIKKTKDWLAEKEQKLETEETGED